MWDFTIIQNNPATGVRFYSIIFFSIPIMTNEFSLNIQRKYSSLFLDNFILRYLLSSDDTLNRLSIIQITHLPLVYDVTDLFYESWIIWARYTNKYKIKYYNAYTEFINSYWTLYTSPLSVWWILYFKKSVTPISQQNALKIDSLLDPIKFSWSSHEFGVLRRNFFFSWDWDPMKSSMDCINFYYHSS